MSQPNEKNLWLNRQKLSFDRLIRISAVSLVVTVIGFIFLYNLILIISKSLDTDNPETDPFFVMLATKGVFIYIVIFVSIIFVVFAIIFAHYYRMKNILKMVNIEEVDTIKVEITKVRFAIFPESRYTSLNPYLVVKYKHKDKKHKGYYFPMFSTFDSPKELKENIKKLKRINVYRNTNVIECIEFYDDNFII